MIVSEFTSDNVARGRRHCAKRRFRFGSAFDISVIGLFNRNDPVECILDLAPLDTCHCIVEHL